MALINGRQKNLVSNIPKMATKLDASLINPWGIASNKDNLWVVSNGMAEISQYKLDGTLVKKIPLSSSAQPTSITLTCYDEFGFTGPTGQVGPAKVLVATQSGGIIAFNEKVDPSAILVVDSPGKMFTGITTKDEYFFVTDFANGQIEKYDSNFKLISSFTDEDLTNIGYSPYNLVAIKNKLYVSFAAIGPTQVTLPGRGNGYVDVFDTNGSLVKRLINRGYLNVPYGLAFKSIKLGCRLLCTLLVGNQGDGLINIFDLKTGEILGQVENYHHVPIVIDGLHGISSYKDSIYLAAGVQDQQQGLVAKIYSKVYQKVHEEESSSSSDSSSSDSSSSSSSS